RRCNHSSKVWLRTSAPARISRTQPHSRQDLMTAELSRNETNSPRRSLATGLTVLAGGLTVLLRLIPHPANCLPLGAMGIFGGASLLGSLQFFVVTNFCVWLVQPLQSLDLVPEAFRYSRDLTGILTCFAAGLPFFQGDSPLELHAILVGDPRYGAFYLVVGDL